MRKFGVRLKQAREAAGLLQSFVADEIGMTTTNLSRLENGRGGLTELESIERLAKVPGLNVPLHTLLAWQIIDEYPPEAIKEAWLDIHSALPEESP